jgi:hypothetical protein
MCAGCVGMIGVGLLLMPPGAWAGWRSKLSGDGEGEGGGRTRVKEGLLMPFVLGRVAQQLSNNCVYVGAGDIAIGWAAGQSAGTGGATAQRGVGRGDGVSAEG